jgi:hypothetical protein
MIKIRFTTLTKYEKKKIIFYIAKTILVQKRKQIIWFMSFLHMKSL